MKSLNSMTRGSATAAPRHHARAVDAVHGAADDPDGAAGAAAAAGRPGRCPPPVAQPPRPGAAAPPAPPGDDPADADLHLGLRRRRRSSARRCSAARVPPRAPPRSAAPPGAVLSWNDPSGESRTVIRPRGGAPGGGRRRDPRRARPVARLPGPAPAAAPATRTARLPRRSAAAAAARHGRRAVPTPPPAAPRPRAAAGRCARTAGAPRLAAAARLPPARAPRPLAAAPHRRANADIAALTAALREGLGVHSLPPEALVLTPALMRLMGRLVHEATRGTVDLLVARAALKREIRAEVTMIVTRENNPLKFSPSVEVALGHLLSPPARGFMEADQAMRDAYDDLRAHQFGFLAGMRAALEGILKRFDPAQLEGKLTQKSLLSSILPGQAQGAACGTCSRSCTARSRPRLPTISMNFSARSSCARTTNTSTSWPRIGHDRQRAAEP